MVRLEHTSGRAANRRSFPFGYDDRLAEPNQLDGGPTMIEAITVRGFRSLRDVTLSTDALNVVIGPNQSGKTNLLDALDLLARAARGELSRALYQSRGGLRNVLWAGPGGTSIDFEVRFAPAGAFAAEKGAVTYGFSLEPDGQGHVVARERLAVAKAAAKNARAAPMGLLSAERGRGFLHSLRTRKKHAREDFPGQELVLSAIRDPVAYPTLEKVRSALASIAVYPGFETRASWAYADPHRVPLLRQPLGVQRVDRVSPLGDNLTNVLYTMCHEQRKPRWETFKRYVRLGFPDFDDLTFPADAGGNRVALAWIDRRFPDARFAADVLSDGTLCYLALCAILSDRGRAALVAIDEPETHLHPELLGRVVGLMEKAAGEGERIVATTHSDRLLSRLTDPGAIVVANADAEGTHMFRPPREELEAWLATFSSLGELREAGHLEAFSASGR